MNISQKILVPKGTHTSKTPNINSKIDQEKNQNNIDDASITSQYCTDEKIPSKNNTKTKRNFSIAHYQTK